MGLGNGGGLAVASHLSPVEYEQLVGAIREVVHRVVPLNATVLVVSRGDDELLRLGPRQAMHFPLDDDGRYAGYHPADSDAAIAMVEQQRGRGAEYFLLPSTAFWWLEYYEGLRKYLESKYQVVEAGEQCWIVQLTEGSSLSADTSFMADAPRRADPTSPLEEVIGALLPQDARIAVLSAGPGAAERVDGHDNWMMPAEPPADPGAVMQSLGSLEHSGFRFVVIPATAFEWLDEHPEVGARLQDRHRLVTRQQHLCEIYELAPQAATDQSPPASNHSEGQAKENRRQDRRTFGDMLRGLFSSRRDGRRS